MAKSLIGSLDQLETVMDRIDERIVHLEGEVARWTHRALDAEKLNTELEKEFALATMEIERLKSA